MTEKQIQVGIVGASAQKSWAHLSHVPAINGLSGLRLATVATRNEHSARKSAQALGTDRWFSDPLAMINDDLLSGTGSGCTPNLAMGYYDGNTATVLWNYAQHYAMSDNFFASTFGTTVMGRSEVIEECAYAESSMVRTN